MWSLNPTLAIIRIIRFCSLKNFPKFVLYVLAQIMLQYCIYGNTSVQYSDRRAVAEINDLILIITPMDFDIFRETLLICGFQSRFS